MAGRKRPGSSNTDQKREFIDSLDKLFAEVNATDAIIMTAGAIAGMKGYTPLSAMINIGKGVATGTATGSLYNIDPLLKSALTYGTAFAGVPGIIGAYFTLWSKPAEQQTQEEKDQLAVFGDTIAMGMIGLIEAYAVTRPGTVAGVGEIVKGIGGIVPG